MRAAHAEFGHVGRAPGLDVWRIEKAAPVPVPQREHGKFHAGEAYLVLKTSLESGISRALAWEVFLWIGNECSQDEAGMAARNAAELEQALGGAVVQRHEAQGAESVRFAVCFGALEHREGRVAAAAARSPDAWAGESAARAEDWQALDGSGSIDGALSGPHGAPPPSPPPAPPDQPLPAYDDGADLPPPGQLPPPDAYDESPGGYSSWGGPGSGPGGGYRDRDRYDDDRDRYDADRGGGYDDRDQYGGERDRYSGERDRYSGERGRYDGDRSRYDGDRGSRSRGGPDRDRPTPKSASGDRYRDRPAPRVPRQGPSSSISSIMSEMSASRQLSSTLLAMLLSTVDFSLHVATAIWCRGILCQVEFYGEHSLFWAFITLAVFANMLAIVAHIVRSSGTRLPEHGNVPEETDLERKFKERPEECVLVMMLGMINTEFLCFLTPEPEDHATFRKLGLLTSLLEGVPTLGLQIAFLYEYGWYSLVTTALVWTSLTLVLKLMRGWIIFLASRVREEPKVPMGKNFKIEDFVSLPCFVAHSALCLCFIAWLDYAGIFRSFAVDWLTMQLDAAGGLNSTLVGYNPDLLLRIAPNMSLADSSIDLGSGIIGFPDEEMVPPELASLAADMLLDSGALTGTEDISVEVNEKLVDLDRADEWLHVYDPASYELTALALDTLDEVISVRRMLRVCFGAVVSLFVLGCLANIGLLTAYLRMERFREHFQTDMLWRRSLGAAALGVGTMLNGSFLNGFSQTAEGYRLAKRDSAGLHLLFHGIPIVAVASAVAARLDCQHKPCDVEFRGGSVEVYLYFLIVVAAPIIWWQVARLVMQMVAGRMIDDSDEPTDPQLQDAIEPPARDRHTFYSRVSQCVSTLTCFLKWLFALLGMLTIYWNCASYTGDRDAEAHGLTKVLGWTMDPPENFRMPDGIVTLGSQYKGSLATFLFGMVANILGTSLFLVRYSTDSLRRKLRSNPGGAVAGLTLSAMHPEFMGWLADRRDDVHNIAKLGGLSAVCDIPLLCVIVATYENLRRPCSAIGARPECDDRYFNETTGKYDLLPTEIAYIDPMLGFVIFVLSVHIIIYLCRGLVVALTAALRRKNEGTFWSYMPHCGDALTCFVAIMQYLVLGMLVAVYDRGSKDDSMDEKDQKHLFHSMRFLLFTMGIYMIGNLLTGISFLNHWAFSHEHLSQYSFGSGFVFAISCLDGAVLDFLSNNPQTDKDIKFVAMSVALATNLVPNLFIQVIVIMVLDVNWDPLVNSDFGRDVFDIESTVYGSLTLTVVMCVWKLLLVVVLRVTNREREYPYPFRHTPLVFGPTWMANRQPTDPSELDPRDLEERKRRQKNKQSPWGGGGRARPGPTAGGYDDGYDEYGDAFTARGDRSARGGYNDRGPSMTEEQLEGLVEATCGQRCIYRTPDGVEGVFVFLGEDMPYLFVQVYEVSRMRGARVRGQVTFRFSPDDVGGLDREFIEQNISNNPEAAWRSLNGDQDDGPAPSASPYADEPARGGYANDGYADDYGGGGGGRGYGGGGENSRPSSRPQSSGGRRDRNDDGYGDRRPSGGSDRSRGGGGPPSIPKLGLGAPEDVRAPPPGGGSARGSCSARGGRQDTSPLGPPPPPLDLPAGSPDAAMTPRTAARQRL